MYCQHCGNKLPEIGNFCPNCGNRIVNLLPDREVTFVSKKTLIINNEQIFKYVFRAEAILLILAIAITTIINIYFLVVEQQNPAFMWSSTIEYYDDVNSFTSSFVICISAILFTTFGVLIFSTKKIETKNIFIALIWIAITVSYFFDLDSKGGLPISFILWLISISIHPKSAGVFEDLYNNSLRNYKILSILIVVLTLILSYLTLFISIHLRLYDLPGHRHPNATGWGSESCDYYHYYGLLTSPYQIIFICLNNSIFVGEFLRPIFLKKFDTIKACIVTVFVALGIAIAIAMFLNIYCPDLYEVKSTVPLY